MTGSANTAIESSVNIASAARPRTTPPRRSHHAATRVESRGASGASSAAASSATTSDTRSCMGAKDTGGTAQRTDCYTRPRPSGAADEARPVPSSRGLGHHPLKVEARVRIPLGLLSYRSIDEAFDEQVWVG